MDTDITAHLTTGAVIVYVLEALKRSRLPWLTSDSKSLNRFVSAVLALAAATGIAWTYDHATTEVVIRFTAQGLLTGIWEFAKQFVTQQLIYDTAINPQTVKVLQGGPPSSP